MSGAGTVSLRCRKCGRLIERPASRVGALFSCAACEEVLRTPAVASQEQATAAQLNAIERALGRHLLAINIALPLIALWGALLVAFVVVLSVGDYPPQVESAMVNIEFALGIAVWFATVILLLAGARSLEFLGWNKAYCFILFLALWPLWLVLSIVSFFRLRSSFTRLRAVGPRP